MSGNEFRSGRIAVTLFGFSFLGSAILDGQQLLAAESRLNASRPTTSQPSGVVTGTTAGLQKDDLVGKQVGCGHSETGVPRGPHRWLLRWDVLEAARRIRRRVVHGTR